MTAARACLVMRAGRRAICPSQTHPSPLDSDLHTQSDSSDSAFVQDGGLRHLFL